MSAYLKSNSLQISNRNKNNWEKSSEAWKIFFGKRRKKLFSRFKDVSFRPLWKLLNLLDLIQSGATRLRQLFILRLTYSLEFNEPITFELWAFTGLPKVSFHFMASISTRLQRAVLNPPKICLLALWTCYLQP